MKLYYSPGACSLAVRIVLHEMNIQCDYEAVNLKTKKTEQGTDFLTINPKGSVPTLRLDNQEILTENAAIQQYLADTHHAAQLLPPVGDLMRYRVIEWLNFVSTDLHKSCGPLFNSQVPTEIKDAIFKPILKNKLTVIDQHLSKNSYLTGKHFTLPDGYLFAVLRWLPHFEMDLAGWPSIYRYFSELKQRKSIVTALQEEGLTA